MFVLHCSDAKKEEKKDSWWGRSAKALSKFGKKVAVAGALVGAGCCVAAAVRRWVKQPS